MDEITGAKYEKRFMNLMNPQVEKIKLQMNYYKERFNELNSRAAVFYRVIVFFVTILLAKFEPSLFAYTFAIGCIFLYFEQFFMRRLRYIATLIKKHIKK